MQEQLASSKAETIRVIYSNCYDGSGDSNKRLLEYAKQLEGKV
jgi:effector-binding domain-containing protein